jgi:hypothetical protein
MLNQAIANGNQNLVASSHLLLFPDQSSTGKQNVLNQRKEGETMMNLKRMRYEKRLIATLSEPV